MRRLLAVCLVSLAAFPVAANAATVKGTPVAPGFTDAILAFDAAPGETNSVTR